MSHSSANATYPNAQIKATFPSPGVLLLTLARPPVNAFNNSLWFELGASFDVASVDPEVRAVVLNSDLEKVFTAGLDLGESQLGNMQGTDVARTALILRQHIGELQDAVSAIERCDKPVIAAIHGVCVGGGLDIIAACDVRIASSNTVFSIKEVDVGLAADIGSLQRLPPKVSNDSLLRELALTARNFGVVEADKLGLISSTVQGSRKEVLVEALKMATLIAAKSPVAVLGTKHLLNYSMNHTVDEGLLYTKVWNMAMLQADDLTAAFTAFATKKPATFAKLGKL